MVSRAGDYRRATQYPVWHSALYSFYILLFTQFIEYSMGMPLVGKIQKYYANILEENKRKLLQSRINL